MKLLSTAILASCWCACAAWVTVNKPGESGPWYHVALLLTALFVFGLVVALSQEHKR